MEQTFWLDSPQLHGEGRLQGCANPRKFANICEFIDEICEFDLGEIRTFEVQFAHL